jgi:ATP-binding cassette subfamily B protein
VRVILRILGLLRGYPWLLAGAVLSLLLATGFSLVVPLLLREVVDVGLRPGHAQLLLLSAVAILVASSLRGACAYGQGYLGQDLGQRLAYDLRQRLYEHVQRLSFSFHDQSETGQLMSRATVDVEALRLFISMGLLRALAGTALFAGVALWLVRLDLSLALLTFAGLPVIVALAVRVGRQLQPTWMSVQNLTGVLSTVLQENLTGVRVVRAFAREDDEIGRFEEANAELRRQSLRANRLAAVNQPLLILVLNIILVAALWVGGDAVMRGHLTLGDLVAYTQYVVLLGGPVRTLGFVVVQTSRAVSAGQRIFEILDTEAEVRDRPDARDLPPGPGQVRFEHVSFGYAGRGTVLRDITLDARPGQVVALLGATGSGKTSIVHLIPRFYDVTAGRVTVDGVDVRAVTLTSLRRNVGVVLQDVFIFNATLGENIAFGAPGASQEQIEAAARAARLHDFIAGLPEGYATPVGERGVTLSGGQRQRLAIARVLLLDPRVLILDDATSSVDMETEYLIQQALAAVMQGRTTFVVAHRLRTIERADQIVLLEGGQIVEQGTHRELLTRSARYRALYELQVDDAEQAAGADGPRRLLLRE